MLRYYEKDNDTGKEFLKVAIIDGHGGSNVAERIAEKHDELFAVEQEVIDHGVLKKNLDREIFESSLASAYDQFEQKYLNDDETK